VISPALVLTAAIVVGGLVASNAYTGWAWLQARDRAAMLQERLDNTVDVARECSRGVDAIKIDADRRVAAARAVGAAAAKLAAAGDQRADQILARPATVPGNDCASAQAQIDDWLANRQPAKP
jgi:hypothetical protein